MSAEPHRSATQPPAVLTLAAAALEGRILAAMEDEERAGFLLAFQGDEGAKLFHARKGGVVVELCAQGEALAELGAPFRGEARLRRVARRQLYGSAARRGRSSSARTRNPPSPLPRRRGVRPRDPRRGPPQRP